MFAEGMKAERQGPPNKARKASREGQDEKDGKNSHLLSPLSQAQLEAQLRLKGKWIQMKKWEECPFLWYLSISDLLIEPSARGMPLLFFRTGDRGIWAAGGTWAFPLSLQHSHRTALSGY